MLMSCNNRYKDMNKIWEKLSKNIKELLEKEIPGIELAWSESRLGRKDIIHKYFNISPHYDEIQYTIRISKLKLIMNLSGFRRNTRNYAFHKDSLTLKSPNRFIDVIKSHIEFMNRKEKEKETRREVIKKSMRVAENKLMKSGISFKKVGCEIHTDIIKFIFKNGGGVQVKIMREECPSDVALLHKVISQHGHCK